jgi:hypothetical protein
LKEKLFVLIELQECDTRLMKITARKKDLPEKLKKIEEEFLVFKESIEQNSRKYDELKARHTESEKMIKKINETMVKTKERLLEVKNNKEYQAMLKENEKAETSRGDVETEIIKLLEEMDSLSVLIKKDKVTLDEYKKNYQNEKKSIEDDLSSIDTDSISCEEKRVALRKKIPGDILAIYERVKNRNNGVGVISVWKEVCNGCHMNIPPQLYNELQRSTELLACPNCNRIMYFQNMERST